jgi:hypothetical protein
MKWIIFLLVFFISITIYAQEENNVIDDDEFFDAGMGVGLIFYAERLKEFEPESKNAYVLNQLNGSLSERKQFIETDFLKESGFRQTGNVKYRKTESSEKALSIIHEIASLLSLGFVPKKPFLEMEYDRLPKGEFYKFESVFIKSNYKDVTPEVSIIIELEYMLQIEFRNGIIIQDSINYYTDENIYKFEELIYKLPNYPESILLSKNRYLNELQKIKASLERHRNPSENNLRALENLKGSFNLNRR